MRLRLFYLTAVLACATGAVRAQEPQMRLYEQFNAPAALRLPASVGDTNAVATESAETGDLGRQVLLLRRATPRPFQISSQTEYLYDSNILLLDKNRIADDLLSETATASYTPQLVPRLQTTIYAKYQLVRYNRNSAFDFEANAAGISLSRPVRDWFTVYGSAEAVRLYLTNGGGNEFFKMFDVTAGLWRGQTIGREGWLFYGYQFDARPSSPGQFTRVDNAGYIGFKLVPVQKLTLQALYRIRDEAYLENSRNDLNHLVSFTATYEFNNYIALSGFAAYRSNNSNTTGFDYDVVTAGGGLKLAFRF